MIRRPPRSTRTDTLFPYTTLFRSVEVGDVALVLDGHLRQAGVGELPCEAAELLGELHVRLQALGLLGGQRGHVERIGDRTARQVGRHLLGDLQRHLLLRLRRRGAEVRCGADRVERSEERRVGKAWVSTCMSRWWPEH